jgi:hypothetical protein
MPERFPQRAGTGSPVSSQAVPSGSGPVPGSRFPGSSPLQGGNREPGTGWFPTEVAPEQLELLDPTDDGLDFGTWKTNLPTVPPHAPQ